MPKVKVNAYSEFHPQHEALVNFECNTGLDIELLPDFEVEVDLSEADFSAFQMQ